MPIDMYPVRASQGDTNEYVIRILGVDDSNPTEQVGAGVVITRTAEGVYLVTWATNPGVFSGIKGYCFGAATASDVKGYTLTRGVYNSTAFTLALSVWNSSFAAADLIANQYLDVTVAFQGPV